MSIYPTVFKPTNDIEVSVDHGPRYFAQMLFDLMNEIEGPWKSDQDKENSEVSNFIEGKFSLRLSRIFGHIERLFLVIQAAQMVGPNALQEMEALIAKDSDYLFWDPAAYQDWLDETDYGSLLSQQEIPDIAYYFLSEILSDLKLDLTESNDTPENIQLWNFKENRIALSPSDLTCQFGRLFELYVEKS
jgi:hypothetical protein